MGSGASSPEKKRRDESWQLPSGVVVTASGEWSYADPKALGIAALGDRYARRSPFEHLRVLGELGRGSFGTVTRCAGAGDGGDVAVKTVAHARRASASPEAAARREVSLWTEVLALTRLARAGGVASLLAVYEEDCGATHLVLECLGGGELFDRLAALDGSYQGSKRVQRWPTSKAPISVVSSRFG